MLIAVPAAAKKEKRTVSHSSNRLSKILFVSEEALKKDIFAGMRLSEAQTICAEVVWRHVDEKLYSEVQRKIANELISCSPRIASQDPGTFLLDASGLRHLGGESKLCADVLKLISKLGYVNGQIGIADSAFAALVASRGKSRWHMVPAGKDVQFLSRLPVNHLPVDNETQQIMSDLGIKLIGQFAELSASSVAQRFGDNGLNAHKLARGIDFRQPGLPLVEKEFQCAIELGGPVESLNETLFIMKSMLDRLVDSLVHSALCVEEMLVSFYNDDDLFDERPLRLIRPSNTTRFLLDVLRLSLEARPLQREFTGLRIVVSRFCNETWQQVRLNGVTEDDVQQARELLLHSDSSMILLQKFYTRFGEHMLVKATANDQYPAESAGLWQPVTNTNTSNNTHTNGSINTRCNTAINTRGDTSTSCDTNTGSGTNTNSNTSRVQEILYPIVVDNEYLSQHLGTERLSGCAVMKRYGSMNSLVQLKDGAPTALTYRGQWYQIKLITAPECLSGFWWDSPMRKSYYVALIEPMGDRTAALDLSLVILLVYHHDKRSWFVEGVYD